MMWLVAIPATAGLAWFARREWRLWRGVTHNSSRPVGKVHKKSPAQAEAGTGIEYGGHHLP